MVRQAGNSPCLSRSERRQAQRWTLLFTSSIGGGEDALTRVGSRERLRCQPVSRIDQHLVKLQRLFTAHPASSPDRPITQAAAGSRNGRPGPMAESKVQRQNRRPSDAATHDPCQRTVACDL